MSQFFYYIVSAFVLLLFTGLYTLLVTRNLIRILIALEILMKAVTLLIVAGGYLVRRVALAQTMAITLIIIEVVAVATACGIAVGIYRHHDTLDLDRARGAKEE